MPASLNQQFRKLLTPGAGHIMPGAANALAARVIEAAGHKMMMVSGAAVANTYLGVPDIGLVSVTELAAHVAAVREVVSIPILADADTGFGNAINARRTIQLLAIPREVPGIHLCNMVIGGKTPLLPREELAAAGYSVICYANAALQASLLAMQQVLQHLNEKGSIVGVEDKLMMFTERQKVLDADKYKELEKRYT